MFTLKNSLPQMRTCFVHLEDFKGPEKGLFHQWITITELSSSGYTETTKALIETSDGRLHTVSYKDLYFCDNLMKEYAFPML